MKTEIINKEISLYNFENQAQLKFFINQEVGNQLCMSLILLKEDLVNIIELKFENFIIYLKVIEGKKSFFDNLNIQKGIFKGHISRHNLDYIIFFILKYYKDGVGEAEHIDVDFISKDSHECTLTISCEEYKQYSEEEIKKMLS